MLSNEGGDLQNQTYNSTIEMLPLILSCTVDNAIKIMVFGQKNTACSGICSQPGCRKECFIA